MRVVKIKKPDIARLIDMAAPTFSRIFPVTLQKPRMHATLTTLIEQDHAGGPGYARCVIGPERLPIAFFVGAVMPMAPWSDEPISLEYIVYCDPAHRGAGVATALIHDYIQWARCQGASAAFIGCEDEVDGEKVAGLYRKLGFKLYESSYVMRRAKLGLAGDKFVDLSHAEGALDLRAFRNTNDR